MQDSLRLSKPRRGPHVNDEVRGEHDGGHNGGVEVLDPKAEHGVEGRDLKACARFSQQ